MNIEFPKVNNKLAFFDFDHTLVSHKYSKEFFKAKISNYFEECLYMLTSIEEEHKNDKPLPCMQWYINKLFEDGYGIYVLTHEIFNLRDNLKQAQLREFYPNVPMTYLTVDSPEHKIDMMRAVAVSEGCELSDIIFVDDKMETVYLAIAAGIDAKHLSDIVVMYENSRVSQQQGFVLGFKGHPEDVKEERDIAYEKSTSVEEELSEENLADVYLECRRLAEMNGRNKGMDGGIY